MDRDLFMSKYLPTEIGCVPILYGNNCDFSDSKRFRKVIFPKQIGIAADSLLQLIPSATAFNPNQTYILRFPEGVEGSLMKLHQGGMASTIIGSNGKIAGTASLYQIEQSPLFQSFTLISFVTGQYFLSAITSELSEINKKLDEVIQYLEATKRAELVSTLSFAQYALSNYSSIMFVEPQRIATIVNLQRAKITAMADIDFYSSELSHKIDLPDSAKTPSEILHIKKNLDIASQLYAISAVMEVYYSKNWDESYLHSVIDESTQILEIARNQSLTTFDSYKRNIQEYHNSGIHKLIDFPYSPDDKKVFAINSSLKKQTEHPMLAVIKDSLSKPSEQTDLYLLPNGDIYQKLR